MKRITITIPDEVANRLDKRRGDLNVSRLASEAIAGAMDRLDAEDRRLAWMQEKLAALGIDVPSP